LPRESAHILIIDDVGANLGVVCALLEEEGHRVSIANSGRDGVARARNECPDLILLDVLMPGEDGFSVCRRLKGDETTQHIPVIFMTALDDLQDKLRGFAAGGVDYVAKPLQLEEFLSRVHTHLELSGLRRKLEAQNLELLAARAELEERVRSRTAALQAEVEERRRAELELQRSSEQIHDLYNCAPCGYHSLDGEGAIIQVNDTQVHWLGGSREEMLGTRFERLLAPDCVPEFNSAFSLLKQRGWIRDVELQLLRTDGSRMPVLLSATVVKDAQGAFVMTRSTLYDLSERKQTEELIYYMAHHDPLTTLGNRNFFQQQLERLISEAQQRRQAAAILFLDLDQFNRINDSFGHAVGDMALREISSRLADCLDDGAVLARWGGDEFVVALSSRDVHITSRQVAAALLKQVSLPLRVEDRELRLSGSIGISLYPMDGLDAQTLLRAADIAMYHTKEKGSGKYEFFTPDLTANVQHRTNLAIQLHNALARQEVYLEYQPQVDIDSGRIFGAEALMRWQSASHGAVSPTEFIPIAEETGLIHSLGEWALRQACQECKRWHDAGHEELTVAVNLSVRQLTEPAFVEQVMGALRDSGLPSRALELEITESLLLKPTEEVLAVFQRLDQLGIRLTVDDFGVGYSSLSYLQCFPLEALKIDRSFVSRIGCAPHDDAIVSAIVALSQSLRLSVLAEGVETAQQIEFLRALGCRAAQGFFYGKPMDPKSLLERLK